MYVGDKKNDKMNRIVGVHRDILHSESLELFGKIQKHCFLRIVFYDLFPSNGEVEIDFCLNFIVERSTNWMIELLPPTAVRRIKCIRLLHSMPRTYKSFKLKNSLLDDCPCITRHNSAFVLL